MEPGDRLGRYVVLGRLGHADGGFRARDTELERDVAVRVLPAPLARDRRSRERFERQARIMSILSHPNILAIHDLGHHAGVPYAVTELAEGETLRDRLDRGRLPVPDAGSWLA